MITAKEALEKVPAILAKRGWTKGIYENDKGEVCLLGAVHIAFHDEASPDNLVLQPEYRHARKALVECTGHQGITWFNDHQAESITDVLKVVDCALKKV